MNEIQELRSKLGTYFNFSELKTLAFDFSIDSETLNHSTKTEFIIDLINYFGQRNMLPDLIRRLEAERPNVNWPDLTDIEQTQHIFNLSHKA